MNNQVKYMTHSLAFQFYKDGYVYAVYKTTPESHEGQVFVTMGLVLFFPHTVVPHLFNQHQ